MGESALIVKCENDLILPFTSFPRKYCSFLEKTSCHSFFKLSGTHVKIYAGMLVLFSCLNFDQVLFFCVGKF